MPELPEVETIRRTLAQHVNGLKIKEVKLVWSSAVISWEDQPFEVLVADRQIQRIDRRGKYLLIRLDNDLTLIAHMRMTGRLNYYTEKQPPDKHTHVVFCLDKGEVHFSDVRKFGRIQAIPTSRSISDSSLGKLGPEPLELEFTPQVLKERFGKKKVSVKAALLDQHVLAGLGNIYVDESLFQARISPNRTVDSLTEEELAELHQAIRNVLQAGIDAQGTSFRDYRDANGEKGSFERALQVYGRGGEPCKVCGQKLERVRLAGRTTVYCSQCQK
ncbi:bifunctional DNA-formamidopyrimidine glycosylase/DNA-(apurinic or apyrimidinic site) lyase [Desulfosporosinus meridiei]|uniref:Formamidopyrimidine-DNA glycosylase n=1 Tax=Desulfosporosinus meridiei (strain ATCC BAA-275 / DSM 13257 / KCTC 12902 / NCIMB 13706 / S10) TaxID=768704 RepID=J7J0A2_DESMD|nr:bifunctional DNA-formamidopyrimidine glycosylase/DNA-(apurinic or apyrimidinic site) lyase [Desulfosporosinus meridiei]AFQ44753.1 formamidopyrimidine-DNA glycosylase Fpg [Desulfosporosinus meridiei DSM 13257]